MYGKTHHIKFPYKKRVRDVFNTYFEKINEPSLGDHHPNNLVVNLRNEMYCIIDEIYQQLSIEIKHNAKIKPTKRKALIHQNENSNELNNQQPCTICGEKRVINRCHIIPRENGGSNSEDNMIYLCPTHHFLFDQGRLSEEEFNKIDISDKAKDSIEYFDKIICNQHKMYWKYNVIKFPGCNCGSLVFKPDVYQNGRFISAVLKCKNCQEIWFLKFDAPSLNLMEAYGEFEEITENEKQKRINESIVKMRDFWLKNSINRNKLFSFSTSL